MMLKHSKISNNPILEKHRHKSQEIQPRLFHHLCCLKFATKFVANCHHFDSSTEMPKFVDGNHLWLLQGNVIPLGHMPTRIWVSVSILHSLPRSMMLFHLHLSSHSHFHPIFHVSSPWEAYAFSSIPHSNVSSWHCDVPFNVPIDFLTSRGEGLNEISHW